MDRILVGENHFFRQVRRTVNPRHTQVGPYNLDGGHMTRRSRISLGQTSVAQPISNARLREEAKFAN